jgi:hypothetical protein
VAEPELRARRSEPSLEFGEHSKGTESEATQPERQPEQEEKPRYVPPVQSQRTTVSYGGGGGDIGEKIKYMMPYMIGLMIIMAPGMLNNMMGPEAQSPILTLLSSWQWMPGDAASITIGAPPNAAVVPAFLAVVFTWVKTIAVVAVTAKLYEAFDSH